MSKTKSKSSSKAAKPAKQEKDILTKVKDAAVTKPAQTVKAKAQELAKQVAGKEEKKDKKSKKKAKEPTPEPSDSESEESESSESSESESEQETTKPATNGTAKSAKKSAAKDESDESSAESDSEGSDSESEVEAPKTNGKAVKQDTAKTTKKPSDESDDSESDSDSDASMASDEGSKGAELAKKAASKASEVKKSTEADSDSEADDDSDSDSSDESDAEEEKVAAKPPKRKAEDEVEPTAKKTKAAPVDTPKSANLFVGNLSWNVDEAWLREVFEEHGELSGVRIMTDRDSGRSKGFGYVEFSNPEDAAKAHAAKAGFELDGRALNVDFANARPDNSQKQENRRKSYGDQVSEPSDTLFLGNLSFEVGQETVTEAFAPHGTILGIRLPTDRETGQPKGFGYVTFSSADEAKTALDAMQGAYIEGRPVRLDFSAPRPQNGDSPARGRGGFGGRGGSRGGARGGRGGRGGNFGGRGGRGGRGGSTNRGGFGDFSGKKTSFD